MPSKLHLISLRNTRKNPLAAQLIALHPVLVYVIQVAAAIVVYLAADVIISAPPLVAVGVIQHAHQHVKVNVRQNVVESVVPSVAIAAILAVGVTAERIVEPVVLQPVVPTAVQGAHLDVAIIVVAVVLVLLTRALVLKND